LVFDAAKRAFTVASQTAEGRKEGVSAQGPESERPVSVLLVHTQGVKRMLRMYLISTVVN
jgi:hypothetical protein